MIQLLPISAPLHRKAPQINFCGAFSFLRFTPCLSSLAALQVEYGHLFCLAKYKAKR